MQLETQLRQDLDSQTRLASLYKDASQDGEKRGQELTSAVSELQGLLKTANDGVALINVLKVLDFYCLRIQYIFHKNIFFIKNNFLSICIDIF